MDKKWRLEYLDNDYKPHTMYDFKKLAYVWNFLGCKLKRERFGYAGEINGIDYIVTRIA